jgi:hypothetical protein
MSMKIDGTKTKIVIGMRKKGNLAVDAVSTF